MNTSKWMITMVMAAGLSIGGAQATWAAGPGAEQTVAERCAKVPEAKERIDGLQTRITERLTALTERRAAAEASGRSRLVERIDRAGDRLNERAGRLAERETRIDEWAASNCPGA